MWQSLVALIHGPISQEVFKYFILSTSLGEGLYWWDLFCLGGVWNLFLSHGPHVPFPRITVFVSWPEFAYSKEIVTIL